MKMFHNLWTHHPFWYNDIYLRAKEKEEEENEKKRKRKKEEKKNEEKEKNEKKKKRKMRRNVTEWRKDFNKQTLLWYSFQLL